MHLSDAVLESVMVFRLGAGAVAEVVIIYMIYDIRPARLSLRICSNNCI
jgi:hypothetical protein